MRRLGLSMVIVAAAACGGDSMPATPLTPSAPAVSFFVTSATSVTGNLGGLTGADATCQRLAQAAGHGGRTWRAYLSVERDPASGNQPTHARDRINGQWTGSPGPVEHDILTGSNADGTLAAGLTCADWTSDSTALAAQVGHSDGMGPNQSTAGALSSWNAAHTNQNCSNTAPRGGAGRVYCFAR